VLKKPADELLGGEGTAPGLTSRAIRIAKCDLVIRHAQNAVVAQGNPKDLGSQVLQRTQPAADWPAIDHPRDLPDLSGDLLVEVQLPQRRADLRAK